LYEKQILLFLGVAATQFSFSRSCGILTKAPLLPFPLPFLPASRFSFLVGGSAELLHTSFTFSVEEEPGLG